MWRLPCMGRVDSKLFKSWPQGVGWDPIGNQNFTLKYINKIIFSHTTGPEKRSVDSKLLKTCPQGQGGATISKGESVEEQQRQINSGEHCGYWASCLNS